MPRIRKPNIVEQRLGAKWCVDAKHEIHSTDLCQSLADAIRYYLWHLGVPPKIAFFTIKKK